jgi:2-dehydropantoate 2-reductase
MRVAVLGTGALGCVFAARLASVAEVWVLGTWGEAVAAIGERGIRIHEHDETVHDVRVAGATSDPTLAPRCDIALLLVKSYQTKRAAKWAGQVLRDDGLAVSLQNGLDNEEKLALAVGDARSVAGVNYVGGINLGPGEAKFIVSLTSYIGDKAVNRDRALMVAKLLTDAELSTSVVSDIDQRMWEKAIINSVINPLTALWRVPNGEIFASAERRELVTHLAREAHDVAIAKGLKLSFDDPVAAAAAICDASATNHSSMLQDIERGRPTEIDSINGVIVKEGLRLKIPTPYNRVVWELIRAAA